MEDDIQTLFSKTGELTHIVFTASDKLANLVLQEANLEVIQKAGMVRFFAPVLVAKHGSKRLSRGPASSITLTTGTVLEKPMADWSIIPSYATGLHGMACNLALDLAPIRANLISPEAVETELWSSMTEEQMQSFKQKIGTNGTTTKRIGQPADVPEAYIYITKDRNYTGSVVHTDGGALLVGH
ncbi:MAG: hypothetical protein Q9170_000989 [Blastenia crenularia]